MTAATFSVDENIWIPLADGRRLACRLWLPSDASSNPRPAVVEYMPYRKRDATRPRDEPIHSWFAAQGYAALRVDMHGSGDSDGLLAQEFQPREREDALELVAWVAAQAWCDGGVAFLGKSWGGYSALHAAMLRPPALRAVIAVCAGDDRYDQSLHYTGGALLNQQLWWSDAMQVFNMRPPDPAISGPDWDAKWRARLDDAEPWIGEWLNHQRRDHFWRENSVCDDYGAIECAVFAVGGWADYISRSVPRLMAGLRCPRWGLVGPWGHHYPQDGIPGPAIGFLQECKRFLDAAMTGARDYDEPLLRAWLAEWRSPGPGHSTQTGRWVAEREWPSPRIAPLALHLNASGLAADAAAETPVAFSSPQTVGLCAPEWLSQAVPGEAPLDQREDDGRSLCFDTAPLVERIEILGSAVLDLELAANQPVALVAARLNDVAPDGTSLRVALGVLNLTHRESDADPRAVVPGERMRIRLVLPEVGHAFLPGHRIRIALSTSYWPVIWPSPAPVTLVLTTGAASRLLLPVRPPDPADAALRPFDPPDAGPATPITILEPATITRTLTRDLMTGTHTLVVDGQGGFLGPGRRYRLDETGTIMGHAIRQVSEIGEHDPLSARIALSQIYEIERGAWRVRLETATRFSATATDFIVEADARAWHGDELIHARNWRFVRPRDLV